MEAETLVNTMQYSLPEVEAQTTVDTLRDMDGKASVNTLADRVGEVNADTFGNLKACVYTSALALTSFSALISM